MNKIYLLTIVILSAFICHAQIVTVADQAPRMLEIGKPVEGKISGGEVQSYILKKPKNMEIAIHIKQDSSRLHIMVYGGDNLMLHDFYSVPKGDTVYSYTTTSRVPTLMIESTTDYRFELHGFDTVGHSGSYVLYLDPLPDNEYKKKQQQFEDIEMWLSEKAIPLSSLTPGNGFKDMMPLKNILQNVRVVGLGEATHGSKEFFQFKHRMIEFLVKEMGFTVFGLESSQSACEKINDYVLFGKGDAKEVLAEQRFWQWDTQEVLAMIEWMRDYNKTVKEKAKLKFYGFDFQANDIAIQGLLEYFKKVAPEQVSTMTVSLKSLIADDPIRRTYVKFYTFKPEEKVPIINRVNELFHFLDSNKTVLIRVSSKGEFQQAFQYAKLLKEFVDAYSRQGWNKKDPESGVATRDRYMAENISDILEHESKDTRMIIWSHNGHINTSPYNMGYYLRKALGLEYYAFGFSFNSGSFQALNLGAAKYPLTEFTIGPALYGSVGWILNRSPKKNYIVDLRNAPKSGEVATWLTTPHTMRSIGNGYTTYLPSGYYDPPAVLTDSFDGIIFLEKTTRAMPNTLNVK